MPRKPHSHHYIYKTTCTVNGKFYIGMHSTSNLDDDYIGSGKRLWYSINKYGRENHIKEILEFLPDRKTLGAREKEIVNEELLKDQFCMNLKKGGEYSPGTFGKKYTEESRKRMSEWIRTPEMKEKMSKAARGKKKSEEHRKKISEIQRGRIVSPDSKTRHKTKEWNEKISNSVRKTMSSEEVKIKLRKPKTGKNAKGSKRTEEQIAKLRKPKTRVTCPLCGRTGGGGAMIRNHFENCKNK